MTEWEQEQDPAEPYDEQGNTSVDMDDKPRGAGGSDESKGSVDAELPGTYTTRTNPPKTEPEDDDD